ncbi:hypothetical protein SCUP515_00360 [Seiridium cupressi]
MQRRNSTRCRGLSRQKSTSSARSVQLTHIHPDTAEHDAQSAAVQAFARARERASDGVAPWPPPRSVERPQLGRHQSSPNPRQGIRTQQSVRFVQPKASHTRLEAGTPQSTPSRQASTRTRATRNRSHTQPTSHNSNSGMGLAPQGTAADYINAIFTGDEYYTAEDNVASVPSSYHRLRKSKSMYTGSGHSKAADSKYGFRQSTANQCESQAGRQFQRNRNKADGRLKAPRSMSFLRTRREASSFSNSRESAPSIDTFDLGNVSVSHSRATKSESPMPSRPKPAKPDKSFKKTLRDASNDTTSTSAKMVKDGSLRLKARKVSQNFKHKLKNLFNTIKGDNNDAVFPPQQVEARKTHVTSVGDLEHYLGDFQLCGEEKENTIVSRVTSGVPSLHTVPSRQQLRSHQGSLESLHSERKVSDEKSRVTSWSDSDANTHSTTNSSRGEWEKQRLSIVKENGSHVAISAKSRMPIHPDWVMKGEDSDRAKVDKSEFAVNINGQRIYSALMKRIDEGDQAAQGVEDNRQQNVEKFVAQGTVPIRQSSKSFSANGRSTAAIIRQVPSHDELNYDTSHASSTATIIRSPEVASNQFLSYSQNRIGTSASASALIPPEVLGVNSHKEATPSTRSLSSPKLGRHATSGRTISERSSVFFGSPACHFFRTQSPYRRAIRGSMQAAAETTHLKSPEFNPWMKSLTKLRIRRPSNCESEDAHMLAYDESIYSSDDLELANGSSCTNDLVGKFPKPPENHGDVTIFLDAPKYQSPTFNQVQRVASSASSVEWKTWLSANVSRLSQSSSLLERNDRNEEDHGHIKLSCASGHIRENAQINGEDEELVLQSECKIPNPSAKTLRTIQRDSGGSSDQPHSIVEDEYPDTPPAIQQKLFEQSHLPAQSAALRRMPSLLSLKTNRANGNMLHDAVESKAFSQLLPRPLLQTRSYSALRTQNQNIGTPTPKSRSMLKNSPRGYSVSNSSLGVDDAMQTEISTDSAESKFRLPPSSQAKRENISPRAAAENDPSTFRLSEDFGPNNSPSRQSASSKHMVELFLNSRRRRIAGTDDTDAFL